MGESLDSFFAFRRLIGAMRIVVHMVVTVMLTLPMGGVMAAGVAQSSTQCRDGDAVCLDTVQVTATRRPESTLHVPDATTIAARWTNSWREDCGRHASDGLALRMADAIEPTLRRAFESSGLRNCPPVGRPAISQIEPAKRCSPHRLELGILHRTRCR